MAGVVNIIGLISSGLSIGQFLADLAPDPDQYKHAIQVGQAQETWNDGWMPQSIFYNYWGEEIAKSSWNGQWVGNGEWREESFGDGRQQTARIESHGGDDNVCMVWQEFYESRGNKPLVVFGEVLKHCGAPWYPSYISANFDGEWKERDCAWIDQCNYDPGGECRNGAWGGYEMWDLDYFKNIRDNGQGDPWDVCNKINSFDVTWKKKRDVGDGEAYASRNATAEPDFFDKIANDVIYTERPLALRVCESALSQGQSIVSTAEGLFCDMTEHVLYPICQAGMTDACFDVEADDLRAASSSSSSSDGIEARAFGAKHYNPTTVRLDKKEESHHTKRSRAADSLVGNGRTHFYSAGADESDCLTADQIDGDNYTGPVTASPAPFARISNGIIVNPAADDSQVILDCPAEYSPKKRYIRGRPVA